MDQPQNPNLQSIVLTEQPPRETTSEITPASADLHPSACDQEEGGELLLPETVLRDLLRLNGAISSTNWQQPHGSPEADTSPGSVSDPVTPRRIAHYDVFDCLGTGGFALVYRAFDRILKRPRALKLARPDVLTSPALRRRFLVDAVALARLDHPNIVRIYDADESGGLCYLAMELCESGSLADWLKSLASTEILPAAWVANLVSQIADGVQHAHDRGIYHRDLKPGNILLTLGPDAPTTEIDPAEIPLGCPSFLPKVADFGLAKILDDQPETNPTRSGLLGTIRYMAPEQIGEPARVGPGTDVYGLGVVLYELLTRRRPFEGPGDARILDQIRNEEPTSPRAIREDLSRDLETVCLKCLQKNPSDRYQRPSELANELRRILENLPTLARPVPLWKRVTKHVMRYPVRFATLGLAAAALLLAALQAERLRRGEADLLVRKVEVAGLDNLRELVTQVNARDPMVSDRLGRLFVTGKPLQQLTVALILAKERPEYADFCCNWLLEAAPGELGVVCPLLRDRVPGLAARLNGFVERSSSSSGPDKERFDRQRAGAGCALALLEPDRRVWSLLQSSPDPQVRTFLVHLLGPAGVAPSALFDRLEDPNTDNSVKIALIQALDLVPDASWDDRLRTRATRWLLDHYRNDPHSGIHGSTKWLLRHWKHQAEMSQIDRELAGVSPAAPEFRWRISREGLTLITLDDPALDRVIEVSDSEITVKQFLRFNPSFRHNGDPSSADNCPINGVSYYDATEFCNALGQAEAIPQDQACYRPIGIDDKANPPVPAFEPVPNHRDRGGFRLPTQQEFDLLCAAGTTTRRYHGDSDLLLERYAWTLRNSSGQAQPVASLIPNDLGVFDALGNLSEWCDRKDHHNAAGQVVADLRGGFHSWNPPTQLDRSSAHLGTLGYWRAGDQGFRVVRTKRKR
jgi:serine/threonine protein kinase